MGGESPGRAGLWNGVVEAEPIVVGIAVAILIVAAVLYTCFGVGRKER